MADTNEGLLDLTQIQGNIKATRRITIPPFKIVQAQRLTKVRCDVKRVNVMMEAAAQYYSGQAIATSTYTELRPSSSKEAICLRNLLAKLMTIPAKKHRISQCCNFFPSHSGTKNKTIEKNQEEGMDANKTKLSEEKLDKLFFKIH